MKWMLVFAIGVAVGIGLVALHPHPAVAPVAAWGTPSGNGDVNGSGAIDIADAIHLLNYIFASGPGPEPIVPSGGALPATGQDRCYDSRGNVIDCASADFPGQDGFYQAGCPNEGRYVDNQDGTVTDVCTRLIWQKETAPGRYTWKDALEYCDALTLGGHDDWRLPNIRELQSIVDYGRSNPAFDPVFGAASVWYWSSTTVDVLPGNAWDVHFWRGNGNLVEKTFENYVRAVRGGR